MACDAIRSGSGSGSWWWMATRSSSVLMPALYEGFGGTAVPPARWPSGVQSPPPEAPYAHRPRERRATRHSEGQESAGATRSHAQAHAGTACAEHGEDGEDG